MSKSTSDKEAILLQQMREGDQGALKEIFNSYFNYLCTTAYKYIADEHLAKDLTQEVFFELWKRRTTLNIQMSLKFYLRRAVINKSLNHIKAQRLQFEAPDEHLQVPDKEVSKQKDLEAEDLKLVIDQTIDQLPDRCRVIFAMSRYEGLSHKEIASKLDISTKTIENQISKALKILKEKIKPYLDKSLLLLIGILNSIDILV